MKKIIISQRLEKVGKFYELRDNLDIRLSNFIENLGYVPILLPNKIVNLKKFIKEISPKGIILSGGGDPLKKDIRYKIENQLIKISIKNKIPIIGLCRGAQALNLYFGGKIIKVKKHVRKNHRLFGPLVNNIKVIVNSYHDYGFDKNLLGNKLKVLAYSSDNIIKCFSHIKYKCLGIMWHPERYKTFKNIDKKIIRNFF